MTWKLARSKPGRGRAEMQGSSIPLGRNHISPSGGPLPSWALRIVLTFPPPYGAPVYNTVPEQYNANIRVCAAHFTEDYFLILGESSLQCEHYEWKKERKGKGSGVWPSMVTHTRNLSSAFNPSKCTLTAVNTHLEQVCSQPPGMAVNTKVGQF